MLVVKGSARSAREQKVQDLIPAASNIILKSGNCNNIMVLVHSGKYF